MDRWIGCQPRRPRSIQRSRMTIANQFVALHKDARNERTGNKGEVHVPEWCPASCDDEGRLESRCLLRTRYSLCRDRARSRGCQSTRCVGRRDGHILTFRDRTGHGFRCEHAVPFDPLQPAGVRIQPLAASPDRYEREFHLGCRESVWCRCHTGPGHGERRKYLRSPGGYSRWDVAYRYADADIDANPSADPSTSLPTRDSNHSYRRSKKALTERLAPPPGNVYNALCCLGWQHLFVVRIRRTRKIMSTWGRNATARSDEQQNA